MYTNILLPVLLQVSCVTWDFICIIGDRARLALNLDKTKSGQKCMLRFWVHMYGNDIERLNVIKRNSIGGREITLKSLTVQNNLWTLQQIDLTRQLQPYQVGTTILFVVIQ